MPFAAAPCLVQSLLCGSALLLIGAALHDVATRTVPNWIPAILAVAGLGVRILDGGLLTGLVAALIVFAAAAFCWRRGWMGGADVKLLAAASLLVRPGLVPPLVLSISLAGGALLAVYAVLHLLVRRLGARRPGRPAGLLARIRRVERRRIRRLESLPYASAIAAGALFVMFSV